MTGTQLTHRQLLAGDVRLHVVTAGPADAPAVILLHGFPEDGRAWEHQIGPLVEAGFRVIVPDLRGYHLSEKPAGVTAYRIDRLVQDVVRLMDLLGDPRTHLVGHDWGGIIAWAVAMRHPERVARLVILNAPHPAAGGTFLKPAQLRKSWYVGFFQLPWLPERLLTRLGTAALHGTSPDAYTAADLKAYREAWTRPGAAGAMINYYRALLRYGLGRPKVIDRPTLVIWGEQDVALLPELADPPRRWVPGARVERLPHASHWVLRDDPARVNALMSEFLSAEALE